MLYSGHKNPTLSFRPSPWERALIEGKRLILG